MIENRSHWWSGLYEIAELKDKKWLPKKGSIWNAIRRYRYGKIEEVEVYFCLAMEENNFLQPMFLIGEYRYFKRLGCNDIVCITVGSLRKISAGMFVLVDQFMTEHLPDKKLLIEA